MKRSNILLYLPTFDLVISTIREMKLHRNPIESALSPILFNFQYILYKTSISLSSLTIIFLPFQRLYFILQNE